MIRTLKPSRKANCRSRKGVTTVEFALTAPILLAIFVGAIELTRLNFLRHSAANAAYEGARAAIIPGGTAVNAQTEAMRLLELVMAANSVTINVQETTERVTVTVTITVNQNSWGLGRFTANMNIIQFCTLSRENLE